ncbi:ferredoxin-dependent glutamate synthase, chloroplastic-like isoform X1 [Lolium rigidum]|uniref:ferredoxin-dependent glutamate synthase, chloroplastic-like isoform X1 n=1 Tax=Lolium rigidum TaxID=89674 RepID=UPI001F5DA2A9|nr:ferredoxin-dependent glutamate synthase, chloroplastic-like isoform X1 [Lolium rigidum]
MAATLPRAVAPSPRPAGLLPLPRAAPLLLAGRAAARRLRARGARAPALAAARRSWAVSARAVLDVSRHRAAPQKPVQEAADMNDILAERGACGVGFVANLNNEPSFNIVRDALTALGCMEHRGGCGADNDSGDGAGLMSGIPWDLFNEWGSKQGLAPFEKTHTGVGMVFLPQDDNSAAEAKAVVEKVFTDEGLEVLGWRPVPFDVSVVGRNAKETMPKIEQIFVKIAKEDDADDIERELYICRKLIERAAKSSSWADELYFCSLSSKTIIYKGMLRSEVLGQFYLDLRNEMYKSPFAIYHRRFSTNTSPRWPLAQPMRLLGHNGEINTIQGNLNWMRSREATIQSPVWRGRENEIRPFGDPKASDSANLDNAAELLLRSGRSPAEAMMMLVPEAYKNHPTLSIKYPEAIDFYEYYKGQMEAWDGPALLLFSDGRTVGACLDRNGLRPARYWRTSDGFVYVASEVGVIPMDESKVVMKGRLGPGMMITVDLQTGQVLENTEVKKKVASANPYGDWLQQSTRSIKPVNFQSSPVMDNETVMRHQQAFGYSSEDVQMVIETMASQGKEPTFCMGDDIPLAVLSQKPHMLFDYFKQRFAQVTNPAIDPLREGLVMSLEVNIGKRGNILEVGPENADQVTLSSPVLNEGELDSLLNDPKLKPKVLSTYFNIRKGLDGSLDKAINALCEEADAAVRSGSQLLVLSDRSEELEPTRPAIPILLAVGAIHQHLIQNGLRMSASIVADTAQCFSTHQFACLIGYGASAVCPYLALETCRQWRLSKKTVNLMRNGKMPTVTIEQAQRNFIKAVKSGLLKILSKMGISLLSSYCGAQIFEIYGLGQEVVDLAFCGSVSKIGGLNLDELGRETLSFWVKAFSEDTAQRLENFGFIQSRPGGEFHANNPEMSKLLHKAIRERSDNAYTIYQQHLASRPVNVLRDLVELKSERPPIPIGKVEPATSIVERFCTGGMSLGAISRETHEAIAIAMNRIGGKSNSGEGGEDPIRWSPLADVVDGYSPTLPHLKGLQNGDTATSAIKQVASGRFGVTPTFLVNAEQIEIKIAQGAKPGEGGQLPGKKVSAYIARLRNSKPGVPLISPPPHHDIYSIEDLAQLIFDLHQINPKAKVSVKLVAEAGIGTVASGVSKANADVIQISGHDGGTGASPISSIKHAGGPWELGLTETHQTLIQNGLRERVVLRVDGGFRSGLDVLLAAAMGADEYGFGSVAMIATGCVMARICHTNNCPVGVASQVIIAQVIFYSFFLVIPFILHSMHLQREELRARFPGVPGDLVNYFLFVAEEVRATLAQLGYEKLDDIIGHTDLLKPKHISLVKTQHIDLGYLLMNAGLPKWSSSQIRSQDVHSNGPVLDETILADPEVIDAIENEKEVSKTYPIYNVDRAVCGRVAGAIAKKYGDTGFAGQLNITFTGSAGQSFGCFLTPGMNVRLVGEANDYVGKGMAGGELVVVPVDDTGFVPEDAAIVGNTCLYGATGGQVFVRGKTGERFAVRNSLGQAVVEGTGDHCCEYMTGGCVVVLGKVGRNVAAGMTGGLAYILDEDDTLVPKINKEIVKMQRVNAPAGQMQLKGLIEAYVEKTGSAKGAKILSEWEAYLPLFWQLVPPSEEDSPEACAEFERVLARQATAVKSAK